MYSIALQTAVKFNSAETVEVASSASVEALENLSIKIPDGAADLQIAGTSAANADVGFVMIRASAYGAKLTYKLGKKTNTAITLDGPLVLMGPGAITVLAGGGGDMKALFFSNATGADVGVDVVIGRDATP
jgi:hypothetical protein